jgi:hypothetical protein
MSEKPISPSRQHIIEDMNLCNFGEKTRDAYPARQESTAFLGGRLGALIGTPIGPFERTLCAAADLLHDLVRINRADQLRNALDDRASSALRRGTCDYSRSADFVGVTPNQSALFRIGRKAKICASTEQ